ncbi:MAG: folylpolyglutamate synthase/dihydrofolate synthase family protein [Pyrinomonadaceae bacterium]
MNFEQAVAYLLGLGHETLTMKLGLESTELLLAALGNPERSFLSVQIAGTNGKGSTAAMLDSICRAAGKKSGLYTSPHLISITERIRIAGHEISRDVFAALASLVRQTAERLVADGRLQALPTFFEQITAIAFLAFRESNVDLAILETGLGGRLDSTTAAKAGVVGITQIALDHQEYLGESIEEIAAEKAAIVRPGVSAIVGRQAPEALNVILRQCDSVGVKPIVDQCSASIESVSADGRFCVTFATGNNMFEQVWLGLRGRHQIENASVAIQLAVALSLPAAAILSGIECAEHAGRLEIIETTPRTLLDGAHNPAGAAALRDHIKTFVAKPITIVFAAMRDKQIKLIAQALFPLADHVVLTTLDNPRAADSGSLSIMADSFSADVNVTIAQSVSQALELAQKLTSPDGTICVTGSLYLVGEAREVLSQKHMTQTALV